MVRQAAGGVMVLVLIAVVLDSAGRGQPPTLPDRVYVRDKKDGSIRPIEGELKTGPAGYQIVAGGKGTPASPADIIRVVPGEVAGIDRKDILAQNALEEKRDWEKARVGYADLQSKAANAPEKTRRFLEFKVATLAARAADDTPDEAAAQAKMEEAAKLLELFLNANKTGWEVWPVAQTCARVQLSLTKKDGEADRRLFEESARTWGKVVKNADVPADLRLEAGIQEVDNYLRARKWAEARSTLDEVEKTAPAGGSKDRLAIFRQVLKAADGGNPLDGVGAIEADVAKTKDPAVRATGYGMIGELYLVADKPREAMWAFLWVEVVYNHDRDEVLKALVRLSDTFRLQGDEDRTKAYKDKARRYRGTL
ncbi:MAG: hypothetical protein JWO38_74 [Gemmataceae bacterium]|nr:hypothetical protein [Gemmataceae bacterium]